MPPFIKSGPFFAAVRSQGKFRLLLLLPIFCALFIFSTAIYRKGKSQQSYTLLFPGADSRYEQERFRGLHAEQRKIPIPQVLPPEWSLEERKVFYLVKELLYGPGPGMIGSYPFVSSGTRVNNLAMEGRDIYIDFGPTLFTGKSEHYFSDDAVLMLIKKVLRLNFPRLKGIYFTIAGTDVSQFRQNLQAQGAKDLG
ncbi:hypothetical protein P0082_12050 [Candidatus Haliotispira prima]|uniref:GerMN domain-containing protein n=1 Tax=Candidatus Haliotispira prima TaxID=3034016 RepID=A0ABY8MGP9_9SPIO|nr:hypothetical protein P0082_12050 [Candidatus Haliotispira prima]